MRFCKNTGGASGRHLAKMLLQINQFISESVIFLRIAHHT